MTIFCWAKTISNNSPILTNYFERHLKLTHWYDGPIWIKPQKDFFLRHPVELHTMSKELALIPKYAQYPNPTRSQKAPLVKACLRPMITIQTIPSVHPQSLFNLLKRPWIDLSRPPMTSNDLQWPISGYFWLFLAISSYFWIFLAISGYFRLFLTVSHYVWSNVKKRQKRQRDHLT